MAVRVVCLVHKLGVLPDLPKNRVVTNRPILVRGPPPGVDLAPRARFAWVCRPRKARSQPRAAGRSVGRLPGRITSMFAA